MISINFESWLPILGLLIATTCAGCLSVNSSNRRLPKRAANDQPIANAVVVGDPQTDEGSGPSVQQPEFQQQALSLGQLSKQEVGELVLRPGTAQIFADPTVDAPGPKIVVRPPELKELERHAQEGRQRY